MHPESRDGLGPHTRQPPGTDTHLPCPGPPPQRLGSKGGSVYALSFSRIDASRLSVPHAVSAGTGSATSNAFTILIHTDLCKGPTDSRASEPLQMPWRIDAEPRKQGAHSAVHSRLRRQSH